MVQGAVDLYKRKMVMREPMRIVALKLFNLCEQLAGGAGLQLVSVDRHEPHVECSCDDGVPLNGCDLLLSFLVKVGLRALMNISRLNGPGLMENGSLKVSAKHYLARI